MSEESVRGWVVVVKGASSGNGKAMALLLAEKRGRVTSPMDNLFEPSSAGHDIRGAGRRSDEDPTPHLDWESR